MANRAYSILNIKAVQDDQRIITGTATTPGMDRAGDIIEPLGVQFKNPLSLLHQHDSTLPVGTVTFDKPTQAGITFTAQMPNIAEPGPLKDRVDTAWGEVKNKLIRGVSIGFRPIEYSFTDSGVRFSQIEVFELSLVSIPCNVEATIQTVKSIDSKFVKSTESYVVGASRTLSIDTSTAWDGPAAAERMLDAAGFNGDKPDAAKAKMGFLCYDSSAPTLKGSYKLPFADIVGGTLKAVEGGLHAAASRLPQTDIPQNVQDSARAVLDGYYSHLNGDKAASGRVVKLDPGVTGKTAATKAAPAAAARTVPASKTTPVSERITKLAKKTIAEQISAFHEVRVAKSARMDEIMDEAGEKGETLDAAGKEEYDGLALELKEIDEHLARLEVRQKSAVATARPVAGLNAEDGTQSRVYATVKSIDKVAPGIRFARLAKCKGLAAKTNSDVLRVAEQLYGQRDPVIVDVIKASVSGGAEVSGNWASGLVGQDTAVFADFVEFLRPQTIIGKFGTGSIPSLRAIPFRVPLVGQTAGGSGYWVGEGKGKPVTALDFSRTTLQPLKVANIAVLTMEVLRDSSPSAEAIVRDQLAAALTARLDTDFVDPTKTASAGISPASITNGVSAIASSGNTADDVRADIKSVFSVFIEANNTPVNGVWIMPSTTALGLSLMKNALGQQEFPGITMLGGVLEGLPVIVSQYVPTNSSGAIVALVNASDIYLGDDGEVSVDMSTEASLEMSTAPTGDAVAPTAASLVSLWQTNAVGFKAERTINWSPRRASAVALLDNVNWGAAA